MRYMYTFMWKKVAIPDLQRMVWVRHCKRDLLVN